MKKFVMTEEARKKIITYLGDLPAKFVYDPISQLLVLPEMDNKQYPEMENKPEDKKLKAMPKEKAKEKKKPKAKIA